MNDTLKTLSISLCSSLCTALFVVACTAGADKFDDDDDGEWESGTDAEWGSGTGDEWGPGGGTGGDAGPDGVTSAELSDCVLRQIASWEPIAGEDGVEEDFDDFRWEGQLEMWAWDGEYYTQNHQQRGLYTVEYGKRNYWWRDVERECKRRVYISE